MEETQAKAKADSFYLTLIYVGLSTASLLAIASRTLMEIEFISILVWIIFLLTIPVSFIGFGILYGGGQDAIPVAILAQIGVFLLAWYLIYRNLLGRYKKRRAPENLKTGENNADGQYEP
jgi:hypothetical protein